MTSVVTGNRLFTFHTNLIFVFKLNMGISLESVLHCLNIDLFLPSQCPRDIQYTGICAAAVPFTGNIAMKAL